MNPILILLLFGCCGCGNEYGNQNSCGCGQSARSGYRRNRNRMNDCGCNRNAADDFGCGCEQQDRSCGCEREERSSCGCDKDSESFASMPPHWHRFAEESQCDRERRCDSCGACEN